MFDVHIIRQEEISQSAKVSATLYFARCKTDAESRCLARPPLPRLAAPTLSHRLLLSHCHASYVIHAVSSISFAVKYHHFRLSDSSARVQTPTLPRVVRALGEKTRSARMGWSPLKIDRGCATGSPHLYKNITERLTVGHLLRSFIPSCYDGIVWTI